MNQNPESSVRKDAEESSAGLPTPNSNGNSGESSVTADEVRSRVQALLKGNGDQEPLTEIDDPEARSVVQQELIKVMADPEAETAVCESARHYFLEFGFLDEAIDSLKADGGPAERAAAAQALGLARSQRGTAPLIAALFDAEDEVRKAATAALAEIGDPAVSMSPLSDLFESEDEASTPKSELLTAEELAPAQIKEPEVQVVSDLEAVRHQIEALADQLAEIEGARAEAEREVLLRVEQEATFRAEAAARRHEDEEARKKAEEKAARRRYEDERKLASEQLGRMRAESDATDLAEKEHRLRLEAVGLRQTADQLSRTAAEAEAAKLAAARAAERELAEKSLREASEQHQAEIDSLRREEELLRSALEESALRRMEVEAERRKAEGETQQLLEEKERLIAAETACREEAERVREAEAKNRAVQEEMALRFGALKRVEGEFADRRAELEAAEKRVQKQERELAELEARTQDLEKQRRQAQAERMRLESEIRQRAASEQHLLEEVRARAHEQEVNLAEAARLRVAEHEQRRAELEALREKLEAEAQERTEREREIIDSVETLRHDESEMRKRIEEHEARRNSAEETHRLVAEQIQRLEAEAHANSIEEKRALERLEKVRRNVAMEAQARAEQEERIRKEIESLEKLEIEKRQRIEKEIRRRADIEHRLQLHKEQLQLNEEERVKAEVKLEMLTQPASEIEEVEEWHDDPVENLRRIKTPVADAPAVVPVETSVTEPVATEIESEPETEPETEPVEVGVHSPDKTERVAALGALAFSNSADAQNVIVAAFDDPEPEVRNAAALALRQIDPHRPVDPFTKALEEASPERRKNIGAAIAASGLAAHALNDLDAESREDTYNALCLLFVMAKTGEVQPLVEAIEKHGDVEVRRAAIKLLNLSGQSELAETAAKRRLGLEQEAAFRAPQDH